ncbi:MAG: 50S ribosomal protein L32 [Deltaproteobacteria bacterium]|nr:50S ribosomal protein L32 [Deltaproteobacteria bacterium]MBF0508096.1 50S ribosomal protein L32 [Deltaproteobacteria bacterium]MBF0524921.1 50S ribosomal protein L32 [Deltaproteobacteria bacterium]
MAVPKRRKSKARKNTRRSHDHVTLPNVVLCPQCNEPKMPHRVCLSCGVYKGETVLEVEG